MTLPEEEPDVIDGLLGELLGESSPPDVSSRVLERLSEAASPEQLSGWARAVERAWTELDQPSPWLIERAGVAEATESDGRRGWIQKLSGRLGVFSSRFRSDSSWRLGAAATVVLVAMSGVWWLARQPRFAPGESVVVSLLESSELESRRLWAELNRQAGRSQSLSEPADRPLGGSALGGPGVDGASGVAGSGVADSGGLRGAADVVAEGRGPGRAAAGGGASRESVESIFYRSPPRSSAADSKAADSKAVDSKAAQAIATESSAAVAGIGPSVAQGAAGAVQSPVSALAGAARGGSRSSSPIRPLPDHEVVHWIDTLMDQLWQQAAVPAPQRVAGELWQRRVGQLGWGELPEAGLSEPTGGNALAGPSMVGARRAMAGGLPPGWDRPAALNEQLAWLFEQVNQRQFAEYWASELTEKWLPEGNTLDSAAAAMFTEELAARLHLGRSIARIQKRVMRDAVLSLEACNSDPTSPMLIPLVHAAEHGSGELVDRLYSRWAGAAVSCGRCHHDRPVAEVAEEDYWGLAALLQPLGVEARPSDSGDAVVAALRGKRLTKKSHRELFRERPDGRLVAAVPRLPGGSPVDGALELPERLQLMADWLESEAVSGPSLVNWVWQQMIGRPLVPALGVTGVPVDGARRELLELLETQLRAHGGDMRRLVVWIAASRPMWAEQVELEAGELLLMNRQSSDRLRRSDLTFATYRHRRFDAGGHPLRTIRRALLAQGAAAGGGDYERRVLAQADLSAVQAWEEQAAVGKMEVDPWLVLHWQRRSAEEMAGDRLAGWRVWLERLSRSGLDWQGQLDHLYWATASGPLQLRDRQMADDILKSVSGDANEAMNRIMTILLGF
jgi:hypothetical protein